MQFANLARSTAQHARAAGLEAPVFRSPPRIVGVSRTIRRRADATAVVAVAYRRRPLLAVVADLIEGVIMVNQLEGRDAARARDDLWERMTEPLRAAA